MQNAVPDAVRILDVVKKGSSLPLVLEDEDGKTWFVKCAGSGHGIAGSLVEYLASSLGIAVGLRILPPSVIRITPILWKNAVGLDPEILHLLRASEGMNLAFPYHAERTEYVAGHLQTLPEGERLAMLLFDILILNVDRTRTNSNLFLLDGALHGCDYGSAMELRAALAGTEADEDASLREIRRHPFYRGNYDGMLFAEKTPRLILGVLDRIRASVPAAWASAYGEGGEGRFWTALDGLFRSASRILARRLAKLKDIEGESDEDAARRRLENRRAFEKKWRKELEDRNAPPAVPLADKA
jgi:hypothetical protein